MPNNKSIKFPYAESTKNDMVRFYNSLNEKDKRHYAALESRKLGYGGITYVAELFNCSRSMIQDGIDELKKNDFLAIEQVRRFGGGRKDELKKKC